MDMKEGSVLPFMGKSDHSNIGSEFLPPPLPSPGLKKRDPVSEEDELDAIVGDSEPSKKRRQGSMDEAMSSTRSVLEPRTVSTVSLHKPGQSPSHPKPQEEEDSNDRTSEDYYFDSYSHHAIRKIKQSPPIPVYCILVSNFDYLPLQMKKC
jgi:hypothetical protein